MPNSRAKWCRMFQKLLITHTELKNASSRDYHLTAILILGVISGLPFLLTLSTLSFWLTEAGISKTTIGLFMLASLPYSIKFLWAPFLDQVQVPYLALKFGQRRAWLILTQICLILSLVGLGNCSPEQSIPMTAVMAFLVSFFSATQDIIIDAYRIEILSEKNKGMGAAFESIGFRLGMLASGAGALYLASLWSWQFAYWSMAVGILLGMIGILFIEEPDRKKIVKLSERLEISPSFRTHMRNLFVTPWSHLAVNRKELIYLLAFVFFFKMGDTVLNAMSAPFICDLGFSKVDFASVSKVFGITLMVFGGLAGGIMIHHVGILQSIILCVGLQGISCLMFVIQSLAGYHLGILMITVGVESFCSGLSAAVFIAFLSEFCSQPHTASHFTLLYSFGSLCRVITSALAGWMADCVSWTCLFFITCLAIVPALIFLNKLQSEQRSAQITIRRRSVA